MLITDSHFFVGCCRVHEQFGDALVMFVCLVDLAVLAASVFAAGCRQMIQVLR